MLGKKKIPPHKKYSQRIRPGKVAWYLDLALIGMAVVVIVLIASTAMRFVRAETKSLAPVELTVLRTQISNACGTKGIANQVADVLQSLNDDALKFDVVDMNNYDNFDLPQSLVLVRDSAYLYAKPLLAARLGIQPENVYYKPLTDNFLAVQVSVVVGKDWKLKPKRQALLTTEILNGCGIKGTTKKLSLLLAQKGDAELAYRVTRTDNYRSFDVKDTKLIIRSPRAQKFSDRLASDLEVKRENVILETAGRDSSVAEISIILGRDWGSRLAAN